jgi:Aromatic-ring hydroxylase, C-terminal
LTLLLLIRHTSDFLRLGLNMPCRIGATRASAPKGGAGYGPVGDVPATALLIRPDGYVARASSAPTPDVDELILAHWFGITMR